MIQGLVPNIQVIIMPEKKDNKLAAMLRRKEEVDELMLAKMQEMADSLRLTRVGTSHVGGG